MREGGRWARYVRCEEGLEGGREAGVVRLETDCEASEIGAGISKGYINSSGTFGKLTHNSSSLLRLFPEVLGPPT